MNGLSVKGEHSLDVMETPSIELPTLAIEKPSKIPTPTFTSSYVDRMATEDIPSDPTYKTKLPALEGMPLPRSMPAVIKPECCDKRDNLDPSLPLDLLSDSSSSLPFNYESKPTESDVLDVPPAPAQPSVMSTFDHGDLHTPEDQEKVSAKESSQHPAEALQSHDLQDTHKPSGDPEEPLTSSILERLQMSWPLIGMRSFQTTLLLLRIVRHRQTSSLETMTLTV